MKIQKYRFDLSNVYCIYMDHAGGHASMEEDYRLTFGFGETPEKKEYVYLLKTLLTEVYVISEYNDGQHLRFE